MSRPGRHSFFCSMVLQGLGFRGLGFRGALGFRVLQDVLVSVLALGFRVLAGSASFARGFYSIYRVSAT